MDRPTHFTQLFIATRNLPYGRRNPRGNGAFMVGGVLRKGTPLWAESSCAAHPSSRPAWIEDVGEVYVDGRCLVVLIPEPPPRMTQLATEQQPQTKDTTLNPLT